MNRPANRETGRRQLSLLAAFSFCLIPHQGYRSYCTHREPHVAVSITCFAGYFRSLAKNIWSLQPRGPDYIIVLLEWYPAWERIHTDPARLTACNLCESSSLRNSRFLSKYERWSNKTALENMQRFVARKRPKNDNLCVSPRFRSSLRLGKKKRLLRRRLWIQKIKVHFGECQLNRSWYVRSQTEYLCI